jgi:hypothetical protein
MPNSRCIVIVTAVGHWRKDEGFSEKIFGIPIIESMFAYDFINFPSCCQAARINCRVIATLSTSPKFSAKLYPLFQTIFNRVADPEGIVTQNNYCSPGLGAGASTSTKPPISAAAEMGGFCILCIQMHCLPVFLRKLQYTFLKKHDKIFFEKLRCFLLESYCIDVTERM